MREKRPDKILKLIQDLQRSKDEKMSVNVRRSVARWNLDDLTIVQAAGRAIESDYVFILLVKAQQLTQMKDFEESMALLTEIERVFRDKPISSQKIKAEQYLQILKTDLKMAEYNDNKGLNMEQFDFILSKKDNQWNLVRLAFLISSAVSNFHQKRYNNGDFKENCRKLAEMILPVLQQ